MKTFFKITLICLFVSAFTACSDDEETTSGGVDGVITAKVSGKDFESIKMATTAVVTNGVLALQGSNSSGDYIRLNILSYKGAGTYKSGDLVSNANSMMYGTVSPIASWVSTFNIGTGTLTVSSDDGTTIEGTFSFEGEGANSSSTGTKKITNGKFKVAIQ